MNYLAVASTATIKILTIFISHLPAAFPSSELSALDKTCIPIRANHTIVESCSVYVPHASLSIETGVVFDEAETARSLKFIQKFSSMEVSMTFCFIHLFELIETHNNSSNVTASWKKFVNLLFGRVKGWKQESLREFKQKMCLLSKCLPRFPTYIVAVPLRSFSCSYRVPLKCWSR